MSHISEFPCSIFIYYNRRKEAAPAVLYCLLHLLAKQQKTKYMYQDLFNVLKILLGETTSGVVFSSVATHKLNSAIDVQNLKYITLFPFCL